MLNALVVIITLAKNDKLEKWVKLIHCSFFKSHTKCRQAISVDCVSHFALVRYRNYSELTVLKSCFFG